MGAFFRLSSSFLSQFFVKATSTAPKLFSHHPRQPMEINVRTTTATSEAKKGKLSFPLGLMHQAFAHHTMAETTFIQCTMYRRLLKNAT